MKFLDIFASEHNAFKNLSLLAEVMFQLDAYVLRTMDGLFIHITWLIFLLIKIIF